MHQGGSRSGTSGVCSPSLTLDSGRGSSSAPSSPAKEMSPVQMMASVVASSGGNNASAGNGAASSIGTAGSSATSQSHNASPVFARKLSRPMEYLLGQGLSSNEVPGSASSTEPFIGVDPHYSNVTGLSSGNYTSFCSGSEPISFATSGSSGSRSSAAPSRNVDSGNGTASSVISSSTTNNFNSANNNVNVNVSGGGGFSNSADCEILQITEDFDDVVLGNDEEDVIARKDSLEEDEENVDHHGQLIGRNQQVCGGGGGDKVQPQFLVGGDIMQPDLNVPNEVFGPLSHAEILNRRNNLGGGASAYNNKTNNNLLNNSQHSSPASSTSGGGGVGGKQGSHHSRPALVTSASAEGYGYTNNNNNNHAQTTPTPSARARSSSGGEGASARSTPLSALYGTPHWWPDSPPLDQSLGGREMGTGAGEQEEELQLGDGGGFIVNCCPPPPNSSANASPFKKPFLLNHNNTLTNRLKGISSISAATDHHHHPGKDLSLDGSTHSQRSSSTPCTSPPPPQQQQQEGLATDTMACNTASAEVKKFTPMAFTITLGDSNEAAISEAAEAKKAAIAERLSKFAPRHRRNASLTKSDDVAGAAAEHDTKSSSLGRTPHQQRQSSVTGGGGESSALKCASLPKKLSSCSAAKKHPSGGSNNDSGLRSLSPETISSTTSSSSRRSRPFINETTTTTTTCSSNNKRPNYSSDNNNSSASVVNNSSMGRKSSGGGGNNNSNNRSGGASGRGAGTPQARRSTTPSEALRSNYKNGGINSNKAEHTPATAIKLNDLSKSPATSPPPPPAGIPPPPVDKEDTASEAGTYTVEKEAPEVQSARENIEQIFGLNDGEVEEDDEDREMDKENNITAAALAAVNGSTSKTKSFGNVVVVGGAEPGTRDWVREWAELAAQQHQQKKQNNRPEMPDSQYFLRETETLVSAIQERVSKHMKSSVGRAASLGGVPAGSDDSDQEEQPSHQHQHQRLHHHQHHQLSPVKSLPQSQHSTPTNNAKRRPPSRTSPFHRESSVLSDSGIRRGGGRNFGYESTDLLNNHQSMTTSTAAAALLPLNNARGVSPRPAVSNSLSKFNNNIGNSNNANAGATNSTSSPNFLRNDGGRFSLRMAKSRTPPAQMPPPAPRQNTYSGGESHNSHGRGMTVNGHSARSSESREQSVGSNSGSAKKYTASGKVLNSAAGGVGGLPSKNNKPGGNRSNSTLTAKEVELANWKRRKNYDPMKAAAEGKNKNGSKKNTNSNGVLSSGAESGGEGGGGASSAAMLPPIASPKVNRREAMMTKSLSFHQESYSPKCPSEDEDMIYIVDEMDSSHSNSPNHLGGVAGGGMAGATGMAMTRSYHEDVMYYGLSGSPASSGSMRPKNKLEALDNLVIATIHSLSNKVRTSSRHLLEKLQTQHANDENGALLEEMVSQLKELEAPSSTNNSSSSPNKSPSRELSGTLKNLKKLEQVVLVLDKVLCDGFDSDEVNG